LELYAFNGKITVLNEVNIEHYLQSVLSARFPTPMDQEAMCALAIVERTHAYYTALKTQESLWQVEASHVDYHGAVLTEHNFSVDQAVATTRHAVLTLNGVPFPATWTQNSAGSTASFTAMFRKSAATPKGVAAPIAARHRQEHKWSFAVPKTTIAKVANLPQISAVDLFLAPETTKVYAIRLTGNAQTNDIDFFTLQRVLGPQKLRSSDFTVTAKGSDLVFTGYGDGPGTGLCLYSAEQMSERGDKASKILSLFFPETKIAPIASLEGLEKIGEMR
jgi:stage II sporulation protein D